MRTLYFQQPMADVLDRFLVEPPALDFGDSAVGATAKTPHVGFTVNRTRIEPGTGEQDFDAAQAALQRREQFRLGWVAAWSPETPLEVGQVVAIIGQAMGFWWLNSCRIVDRVPKSGPITTSGFAYGTLPGHVESGEERFLIEWDRNSNQVVDDLLTFSKPNHVLTRRRDPLVRRSQQPFGRDSAAAMSRVVSAARSVLKY